MPQRRTVSEITRKEWLTSIAAATAGTANAAGLMVLITPAFLGLNSFWELFVTSAAIGAAVFPPAVVRLTNGLAMAVIAVTRQNRRLVDVLGGLVREFGLASVTTPIGLALALLLWSVFGAFLIPGLLIAVDRGGPLSMPHFGRDLIVGYAVYGLSLGGFYGLIAQEYDVRGRLIQAVRPNRGRRLE